MKTRVTRRRTNPNDVDKVQSTLKQLVRDWSEEGEEERRLSYEPLLDELERFYGDVPDRNSVRVLVPGAGLARLAYEVAKRGFQCQGNEFSLYMLIAANFILNRTSDRPLSLIVHPWLHQYTNVAKIADQTRAYRVPDVDPSDIPQGVNFSMAAGDFLEVYAEPEYDRSQDVVLTCFFMDCAHNVLDFIALIRKVLKPGGRWINLGPLLYHFADVGGEDSIEPPWEVVRALISDAGFEFEREEEGVRATYVQNPASMLQFEYRCVRFTARRI